MLLLTFSNVIILPICFENAFWNKPLKVRIYIFFMKDIIRFDNCPIGSENAFWNEPLEAGSLGLVLVTFISI